jgi:23S rRNA (pseudouridine1915-N3)-methyltransferase
MRLRIMAVGRLKDGPERTLIERYRLRIDAISRTLGFTQPIELIEIPESRARREEDRRKEEAALFLKKLNGEGTAKQESSVIIALDERAPSLTSPVFAAKIGAWRDQGAPSLTFIIGGPDGFDPALLQKATLTLSFGALTLPHQIVRALVTEQIYRALSLLGNHPYHRQGADEAS